MTVKTNIKNLIIIMKMAWQQNRYLILWQLFLNTVRGPFPIAIAYFNKLIIDRITGSSNYIKNGGFSNMVLFVVITIVIQSLYEYLMTLDTKLSIISSNNIYVKFQNIILEKIKEMDRVHFETIESKDIIYRGMNFDYEVVHNTINSLSTILRRLFTAIIAGIVLMKYSYILTVLVIVIYIPNFIAGVISAKKSMKLTKNLTIYNRKKEYFSNVLKSREYAEELKIYNANDFFINKYLLVSRMAIQLNKKFVIDNLLMNGLLDLLQILINGFVYGVLIVNAYIGKMTIGDINFVKSSFDNLGTELYSSLSMLIKLYKDIESYDFFEQFTKLENKINIHKTTYVKFENKEGHKIEFRNVYFSYPGSKKYALENVSFIIEKGEKIGLVGANGSGKTTLIKLLLHMYDCNKGTILIDDIDIRNYDPFIYRAMWGVQQQDYCIYPMSIAENIAIGKEKNKITIENLLHAAGKSDSTKFIQRLEKGFDTQIYKTFEQTGYIPSGGEKQKIALARLFYEEFDMYILDEPSASIDAMAEDIIFNTIEKMLTNKTTLFVTHRFSNLKCCNRVILLEDGKLLAIGTHKQLMENAMYSHLYNIQKNEY